jgi:hypothetical protein
MQARRSEEMLYFCIEKEKSGMKNKFFKKRSIAGWMLLVVACFQIWAKVPSPAVAVEKVNGKAFRLYVKTLDEEAIVEITNQAGEVLLTEVLAKGYIYRKTYDISELPGNIYYVKVSDPLSTKEFAVLEDRVQLLKDEKKTTTDTK